MNDFVGFLIDACQEIGLEMSDSEAQRQLSYLDGIYEKNDVLNLTRVSRGTDAVVLHIVDALVPCAIGVSLPADGTLLDIGTGGGFPGVPLSIHTGCRATLIDSVGKKISAVEEVLRQNDLDGQVQCRAIRAEDLAREVPERFEIVTARAVAPLETILEYATPLLTYEGTLICYKSKIEDSERDNAELVARHIGMKNVSRETIILPFDFGIREISVWQRVEESEIDLPRRTGMARKKPLSKVFHVKH